MEIGTNAIGSPFWMGESEEAGVDLMVPLRRGAALVGGRIRQKESVGSRSRLQTPGCHLSKGQSVQYCTVFCV